MRLSHASRDRVPSSFLLGGATREKPSSLCQGGAWAPPPPLCHAGRRSCRLCSSKGVTPARLDPSHRREDAPLVGVSTKFDRPIVESLKRGRGGGMECGMRGPH